MCHPVSSRKGARKSNPKYLPPELWEDIFSRLPVLDLLKIRCASKTWCYIVDSTEFINLHTKLYKNNHHENDILVERFKESSAVWELSVYSSKTCNKIVTLLSTEMSLCGVCNGLLLMQEGESLKLRNPSIRKALQLPSYPFMEDGCTNYLLGYAPSSNDYKVVAFCYSSEDSELSVSVYSFRDHCWRLGRNVFKDPVWKSSRWLQSWSVTFLEKASYWFESSPSEVENSSRYRDSYLVSYDFDVEKFSYFKLPDLEKELTARFHFIYKDSLAVLSMSYESSRVWVLNKASASKTSSKTEPWKLLISSERTNVDVDACKLIKDHCYQQFPTIRKIVYVEDRGTFFVNFSGKLVSYNISNHEIQHICDECASVNTYVESLAWQSKLADFPLIAPLRSLVIH